MDVQDIIKEAQNLSIAEQAADKEWTAEIKRHVDEVMSGEAELIPAEQARYLMMNDSGEFPYVTRDLLSAQNFIDLASNAGFRCFYHPHLSVFMRN